MFRRRPLRLSWRQKAVILDKWEEQNLPTTNSNIFEFCAWVKDYLKSHSPPSPRTIRRIIKGHLMIREMSTSNKKEQKKVLTVGNMYVENTLTMWIYDM